MSNMLFKDIELHKKEFGTARAWPVGMVINRLDVQQDIEGIMRAKIVAALWCEKVGEEEHLVEFIFPKDWWQHLKRDHAPEWFIKRWPVKYKDSYKLVVTHWAGYPELPLYLPNTGHVYKFNVWPTGPYEI